MCGALFSIVFTMLSLNLGRVVNEFSVCPVRASAHYYTPKYPRIQPCPCTNIEEQVLCFLERIGFSYYFQRGQFWYPLHVYIGVVSSLISTDTFPLLFPVSEINRISNCLVLPHQRENMIYETSSHEKPILRDYLLITETAQLTDKGKRGDLCWMRNTVYVRGRWRACLGCVLPFNVAVCELQTNKKPKKESQCSGSGYLFVFLPKEGPTL